jgi:predicted DsbA family dithiol-disulfide isomerase
MPPLRVRRTLEWQPMKVEIWSDVVCPWCYIGKRRFERALSQFAHRDEVEIIHRSFQLDPAASVDRTEPTPDRLARKYGTSVAQAKAMMDRVEQTAAGDGLEFHLAGTLGGNTLDAHRVLHLAKQRGLQDDVLERFYRAYFTECQSLFDHLSLVRLAAEAGLDPEEVQRVLDEGTYAGDVRADGFEAMSLGVQGVPFFVIDGRFGISGAQPAELLAQALAYAWAEDDPLATAGETHRMAGAEDGARCDDEICAAPPDAEMAGAAPESRIQ